jgi:hypothetical protein
MILIGIIHKFEGRDPLLTILQPQQMAARINYRPFALP